jgi:hypothetical protein
MSLTVLIGLIGIIAGLAAMGFAVRRMSVRNSRGNFAQNTGGSVNQTYTETGTAAPPAASAHSFEDRVLAWGGFLVALAGLAVSIVPLLKH